MPEKKNKRAAGAGYEEMAAQYLLGRGYQILERNYRNRYGEIDIIAKKDSVFIYCEVKFRSSDVCGGPAEAVTWKKQKRISRTALYYCMQHGISENSPGRFDVIAIYGDGRLRHIENAFELQS